MITSPNENRITPLDQRRLCAEAGCISPLWLSSFLYHCDSLQDAQNTIASLQKTCPDKFKPSRQQQRQEQRQRREEATPIEYRRLDWRTVDDLVRESGAVDRPLLASYLIHAPNERTALRTIEILRRTDPEIFRRRRTPPLKGEWL